MGRDPGDAQTGTELIADLIRERDGLIGGHDRELGGSAESPVRLGAIDPDALADATTLDTIADSVDDARAVAVRNHARVGHAIPPQSPRFFVSPGLMPENVTRTQTSPCPGTGSTISPTC